MQVSEQPSPPVLLPSSHSSPSAVVSLLSPHQPMSRHIIPGVGHAYPRSTWQLDEQPSLLLRLPSSQYSPKSSRPSPQMGIGSFMQAPPMPALLGHDDPASTR